MPPLLRNFKNQLCQSPMHALTPAFPPPLEFSAVLHISLNLHCTSRNMVLPGGKIGELTA